MNTILVIIFFLLVCLVCDIDNRIEIKEWNGERTVWINYRKLYAGGRFKSFSFWVIYNGKTNFQIGNGCLISVWTKNRSFSVRNYKLF